MAMLALTDGVEMSTFFVVLHSFVGEDHDLEYLQ